MNNIERALSLESENSRLRRELADLQAQYERQQAEMAKLRYELERAEMRGAIFMHAISDAQSCLDIDLENPLAELLEEKAIADALEALSD